MARIRTVKPALFGSPQLARCGVQARFTFVGLLTESDDQGRQLYSPARIAGSLFPLDNYPPRKVDAWVSELENAELVHRYESNGTPYLCIPNFRKHQVINKPRSSTLPACPSHGDLRADAGSTTGKLRDASHTEEERKGREEERKGKKLLRSSAEGDELCERFCDLLQANGVKRPKTLSMTWRNEARLLLEYDNRDYLEARSLMQWCQADPFWHMNILSVPKFRKQYDQLRLKAQAPEPQRPAGEIEQFLARVEEVERGRRTGGTNGSTPGDGLPRTEDREAAPSIVVAGTRAIGSGRGW